MSIGCPFWCPQVCAHIVQAIRMEATRVREEWEHAISSKENANSQPSDDDASSDAYCFELLSMVLALSGSNVGRQYLAQQLTLLQDLFSLLHTASPRVQRQVCMHVLYRNILYILQKLCVFWPNAVWACEFGRWNQGCTCRSNPDISSEITNSNIWKYDFLKCWQLPKFWVLIPFDPKQWNDQGLYQQLSVPYR